MEDDKLVEYYDKLKAAGPRGFRGGLGGVGTLRKSAGEGKKTGLYSNFVKAGESKAGVLHFDDKGNEVKAKKQKKEVTAGWVFLDKDGTVTTRPHINAPDDAPAETEAKKSKKEKKEKKEKKGKKRSRAEAAAEVDEAAAPAAAAAAEGKRARKDKKKEKKEKKAGKEAEKKAKKPEKKEKKEKKSKKSKKKDK